MLFGFFETLKAAKYYKTIITFLKKLWEITYDYNNVLNMKLNSL